MKVEINKKKYDVVFNYTALKKLQELTGVKIFKLSELDEMDNAPLFLAAGVFGGSYLKDKTITELPLSIDECIECLNNDLRLFNQVISNMSSALINAFQEKNDKGVK